MSTQQQPTAEKSVQTQDLSGSTLLVTNNPVTHIHAENTATEVANTLVSMATGRERVTTVKQLVNKIIFFSFWKLKSFILQNVISVPTQPTLPILALSDYTTSRGVPTAMALANQAKLTPTKQDSMLEGDDDDDDDDQDDDDDTSMSTDEYKTSRKSTRGKSNKSNSTSKHNKRQAADAIQYGPIVVKPRKNIAPTLANGRRSKDDPVCYFFILQF
jgi:hypothetical protein